MSEKAKVCPAIEDRSDQLVVDDIYITEMVQFYRNTSEKAEYELEQLLDRLNSAKSSAIISGEMALALEAFIDLTSQMQSKILEFGSGCADIAESFVEKIRKLDPPIR